tara:strand:- start:1161 stop:1928 length:768 start_codon:yes stop_codon:yes gene_type:complete
MKKTKREIAIFIFVISAVNICLYQQINYDFIFLLTIIGILYIKLYPKYKIQNHYNQLELLIPLYNQLDIKRPLPHTKGYAASPDFLLEIINIIKNMKPSVIIEAGSGVSTLVAGYALKQNKHGKIFSLDHDEKYTNLTKKEIVNHNLQKYSEVVHAPLIKYDDDLIWYDLDSIKNLGSIDFLIIDGPPSKNSKDARYPAIPLLIKRIKIGGILILDDGRRNKEQSVVRKWKNEFNCFDFKYIDNDKGAFILERIN